MSNNPEITGSSPESSTQNPTKVANQRGRLRFGLAGVLIVIAGVGLAVSLVRTPSAEAPKPEQNQPVVVEDLEVEQILPSVIEGPLMIEGPAIPKNQESVTITPETPVPSLRQRFEVLVTLPPIQGNGDYIKSYTLVSDNNSTNDGIVSGYNYRWGLEIDDKEGTGRPFFQGLIPGWRDAINSHLAYRNVGDSSSTLLLPETTHQLVVQSFSLGNSCVLELEIDNKMVGRNERWNNGDASKCIIPIDDNSTKVGLPAGRLGGIAGYEYPGKVLAYTNTR